MISRLLGKIADYIRETDKILLILCIFASIYGSLLVLSTTMHENNLQHFWVGVGAAIIGLIGAIIISVIDYETLGKRWYLIAGASAILLTLTYFFGWSPAGAGDRSWLDIPFTNLSIQPSEFILVGFIVTFAYHIHILGDRVQTFKNTVILAIHGLAPALLINVLQNNDGVSIVAGIIFLAMFFAAGVKLRYFAIAGVVLVIAAPFIWYGFMAQYQRDRILNLFDPYFDPDGIGYQQRIARMAIGSGGILGVGLFNGTIHRGLFASRNDFIFMVAGEELGMLGSIAIIILLMAICTRALRVSSIARDKMGSMICVGVFTLLAIQAVINIGMNLSLLPVIGINLPFFSSGGSSTVATFLLIGLSLSVFKHRHKRILSIKG